MMGLIKLLVGICMMLLLIGCNSFDPCKDSTIVMARENLTSNMLNMYLLGQHKECYNICLNSRFGGGNFNDGCYPEDFCYKRCIQGER